MLGGIKEGPSEAILEERTRDHVSGAAAEMAGIIQVGGNRVSDLKANVILRAESTRKTERHLARVREGHNPFSR